MYNNADNWLAERGNTLCKWQRRRDLLIEQKFKFSEIFTHHKFSQHFIICLHVYKVVIWNGIYIKHTIRAIGSNSGVTRQDLYEQLASRFLFLELKYNNIVSWFNAWFFPDEINASYNPFIGNDHSSR